MTIQATPPHNPHDNGSSSAQKPPAPPKAQEQPQDTVELSSKAKESGDAEHNRES